MICLGLKSDCKVYGSHLMPTNRLALQLTVRIVSKGWGQVCEILVLLTAPWIEFDAPKVLEQAISDPINQGLDYLYDIGVGNTI